MFLKCQLIILHWFFLFFPLICICCFHYPLATHVAFLILWPFTEGLRWKIWLFYLFYSRKTRKAIKRLGLLQGDQSTEHKLTPELPEMFHVLKHVFHNEKRDGPCDSGVRGMKIYAKSSWWLSLWSFMLTWQRPKDLCFPRPQLLFLVLHACDGNTIGVPATTGMRYLSQTSVACPGDGALDTDRNDYRALPFPVVGPFSSSD